MTPDGRPWAGLGIVALDWRISRIGWWIKGELFMALKTRFGAAIVICVLAGGFAAAPVEPVLAQGLFERLFNPQRHSSRRFYSPRDDDRSLRNMRRQRVRERQWFTNRRFTNQRQRQVPLTPLRVEGAKYYSYKPDADWGLSHLDWTSSDYGLAIVIMGDVQVSQ